MKNLGNILKQAQNMQTRMAEIQEELQAMEVEGQSGAGMVRVTVSGKGEVRSLKIDPGVVDKDEVGVLEDLVVAAVNDARHKAEELSRDKMGELTEGLPLPPGFKLPF